MARRLYYGEILRRIEYRAAWKNEPAEFVLQFVDEHRKLTNYRAPTIEGIIEQLKGDGRQVWGGDSVLDYALPPRNALEYLLMVAHMKAQGISDEAIQREFALDSTEADTP